MTLTTPICSHRRRMPGNGFRFGVRRGIAALVSFFPEPSVGARVYAPLGQSQRKRNQSGDASPHSKPKPAPSRRRWGSFCFLLMATSLIFCHGCHGDEDNELGLHFFRRSTPKHEQRDRPPSSVQRVGWQQELPH